MNGQTTILISAHRLFRETLTMRLCEYGLSIVFEGSSLASALLVLEQGSAPNFVLYEIQAGGASTADLAAILEVRRTFLGAKLVVLAAAVAPVFLADMMEAGIEAYLPTDICVESLIHSLELVRLGQRLYYPAIIGSVDFNAAMAGPTRVLRLAHMPLATEALFAGDELLSQTPLAASVEALLPDHKQPPTLSDRELQILNCLVEGGSNKVIARDLQITEATVKVHIKSLLRKIRATNRTQAAVWALQKYAQDQKYVQNGRSLD